MSRSKNPNLTVDQERFIRMQANGAKFPEIIMEIWGMKREDDPKAYHNLECKLSEWRKHPKYEEVWKDEVGKWDFSDYSLSRRTLRKSMEQENDRWLAMQAAVNVLSSVGKRIYGEDQSTVTVKLEGSMPDLGSPDDDG